MLRVCAAILALSLCVGCPILDELDKGNAEMDKYSPGARKLKEKKEKEAAAEAEKKGTKTLAGAADSAKQAASEWWGKAKSLAPDEKNENVVRCVLPGGDQFMARHDCLMRSGLAK